MGLFSTDLLKQYIAPCVDVRPEANLPDLGKEFDQARHWFGNYFLNSVFTGQFSGAMRPYAECMITRIQFAFGGYSDARQFTLAYSDQWKIGAPGINRYLSAIRAWESLLLNLQVIYDLLEKCFEAKHGDREKRAHLVANRIKHVSEDIRDGKLTGPGMPMWLTRVGLATHNSSVTYDEMVAQVRFLAKLADCLSVPSEAKERIARLEQESSDSSTV